LAGSLSVRNKFLKNVLIQHGKDNDETWSDIIIHNGSVQHLDFLSKEEKDVFKTAYEIDQKILIDLAAQRTPYICQAQSLNLFIPADIHKKDLHNLHFYSWEKGIKSLYYCRSRSIQRADQVSKNNFFKEEILGIKTDSLDRKENINSAKFCTLSSNPDECEACQ
jgi:ribonucleoside-diphosphate reductase alpha chain